MESQKLRRIRTKSIRILMFLVWHRDCSISDCRDSPHETSQTQHRNNPLWASSTRPRSSDGQCDGDLLEHRASEVQRPYDAAGFRGRATRRQSANVYQRATRPRVMERDSPRSMATSTDRGGVGLRV